MEAPRTTGSRDTSHDDAMRFLCELRQLRAEAGLASTELAARAHYPHHVIMAAEAGPSLPDLPVLSAYLRACGAGLADWEERWRSLTGSPAAGHCLPTRPPGCSGLASAGARISAAVPEVQADDQRRIMAAISRAEAAMAAATIPAQPAPAQPPVEATEAAEVCGLEEELETAGTSAASLTDLAVDADAAHGNHEAIDAVAAAATVSTPPAVRSSPASASGFSAGSTPFVPFPRSARSRRSTLPQRAAIAAAVAAVMCVIAAILLVLR